MSEDDIEGVRVGGDRAVERTVNRAVNDCRPWPNCSRPMSYSTSTRSPDRSIGRISRRTKPLENGPPCAPGLSN